MIAEILIFVPSIARFREDYLLNRLERAQIASLALLATDGMIEDDLEDELLENAEVLNVVLRRDQVRQLILSTDHIPPVAYSFDLRDAPAWQLIRDAMVRISTPENQTIRVIGEPVREAGLLIEVTMYTEPLRDALIDYGLRILWLSLVISVVTAALLFLSVRKFLVVPIKRVVSHMMSYAEAPEDARRIIKPAAGVTELHDAETALQSLQTQLTGALRQRERLAQLGEAVAKISHDLRNILTVATLMADRLETIDDPTVKRTTPKLVASLSRAVNLCEGTLAFGRAEEPPPALARVDLHELIHDMVENERLAVTDDQVEIIADVPPGTIARADSEQLYRVLGNLVRNARQVIVSTGQAGQVCVSAAEDADGWWIKVRDTGPGLPQKALDHLFQPFHGGARAGGTGLGLAIAAELIRGHGGKLELEDTGPDGTCFRIHLPATGVV
ncbi:HAMP domain-containing histidine kinase [Rhodophyticola sp. CCM32]|uniref:sensor histidine kinase n=1 Tax=Rhodophyticola sp. CCM32 TaxID=2916397 RepID=UPI00107EF1D1|nr:HAMP domain-containing sensor histidine kinase [Rhodophyticola sp. CCM32]QBY02772.1 HAMP domain-containing histidine kinase [Rhodophyticola sp. CCM32]